MLEIIRSGYIVFIVISVILIFALIGYIADHHIRKDVTINDIRKEKEKLEKTKEEEKKNVDSL